MYAEKRLERLRAAKEKEAQLMAADGPTLSNGTIATNGHANGYTNGVSKRKTQ